MEVGEVERRDTKMRKREVIWIRSTSDKVWRRRCSSLVRGEPPSKVGKAPTTQGIDRAKRSGDGADLWHAISNQDASEGRLVCGSATAGSKDSIVLHTSVECVQRGVSTARAK